MITGGFGFTLDIETRCTRKWVMGRDGIKRWADTGKEVCGNVKEDSTMAPTPAGVTKSEK